jgi:predicted alpha/beta hydrolase
VEETAIQSADGATSIVSVFDDSSLQETSPIALVMPAMGVRASFYSPLATPMAKAGIRLATTDLRGHGNSSVRPSRQCNFGFREMLEMDWPAAIEAVRDSHPNAPLCLLGHSLGGKLNLLYAAANPGSVAAVITVASCSVYWRAFPPDQRWGLLLFSQFMRATAAIMGSYPGHRLGFASHEARGVISDWAHQARTGKYRVSDSQLDYNKALSISTTPALLLTIENDRLAPASSADHLASMMPTATAKRIHLQEPLVPRVHFRWVQNSQPVVNQIQAWLTDQGVL